MTVRMRHTPSHTKNRRSHHAIEASLAIHCAKCGAAALAHTVCANCGFYKGREVVDVLKKLTKKERKQKEKELAAKEEVK
ncbi:50S ribosomal protein L32 [Candidatus Giovannonibacteria bacterium]|nr:50S ribosomal protein L32 [Candidatus Giovannonibacteria bacterium]